MEKTGVFIVVCWINQTCFFPGICAERSTSKLSEKENGFLQKERTGLDSAHRAQRVCQYILKGYAIVHARRNVLCISLLTSYTRDKYVKNPLNLMISIKHKYNIGVFYTIRAPGVHVHAWGLNISLFLCVCRRIHAPLCHYWTCMHTLRWFMMKIHHIYENISSEMYICGWHRNFSAFFCCFISALKEFKKRNNGYITLKCYFFWEEPHFPLDVPAVF